MSADGWGREAAHWRLRRGGELVAEVPVEAVSTPRGWAARACWLTRRHGVTAEDIAGLARLLGHAVPSWISGLPAPATDTAAEERRQRVLGAIGGFMSDPENRQPKDHHRYHARRKGH